MAKELKRLLATQLESALVDADAGLLVLDPGPMTVENVQEFRKDLREKAGGATLRVIHNRTAKLALKRRYLDDESNPSDDEDRVGDLVAMLKGPTAVVYGGDGPIPCAKIVRDWRRKFKPLTLKGAIADGELMDAADAATLADMPGLIELKGMLLSAIIGSPRGIASCLGGVYGGIARCIQAKIDAEGEAGEPVAAE